MEPFSASSSAQMQAILDAPALAPPPGVQPNFENPQNLEAAGLVMPILLFVLATLFLCMRVYTKLFVMHQFRIEDYAVCLGWAFTCGCFAIQLLMVQVAPGVHQWDLRIRDLRDYLYQLHNQSIIYAFCLLSVKLSILLQYLHIFVPNKKANAIYWSCHALIWLNVLYYTITTFCEIFACSPIAKAWDPLITEGHCLPTLVFINASSAINSISDIAILILPQTVIWKLQLSTKKKAQVSIIFLVGILTCLSSIMRLYYSCKLLKSADVTYFSWLQALWGVPEVALGIIVACLPVSARFFQSLKGARASPQMLLLPGSSPGVSRTCAKCSAQPREHSQFSARSGGRIWPTTGSKTLRDANNAFNNVTAVQSNTAFEERGYRTRRDTGDTSSSIYVVNDIEVETV